MTSRAHLEIRATVLDGSIGTCQATLWESLDARDERWFARRGRGYGFALAVIRDVLLRSC